MKQDLIDILAPPAPYFTCQLLFLLKCVRVTLVPSHAEKNQEKPLGPGYVTVFVFTEPGFSKIYRRLSKIAEVFGRLPKIAEDFRRLPKIEKDFPTNSEDNRKCRKIFDVFQTGSMISKGFPTNLEHCSENVLTTSRTFLSNHTH